ncbi:hypothetical protein [Deinococcus cellulosilyticus]|uniref:Uncharacterized protein n=1 Tax=Deinococcus cellulosilyticus (strain DSM 18568 / NBRC 106333 / KACC 11606 / 5516J-15) TaxID=1223518 RepID=A0A511N6G1_DEIC1|nr:hypothetical protein [Deinococcus cellulosilyticus]GEM48459.1 hypothetical protein DC3_40940 [Deinococcus cellulosilyticus NBRC 106333 = KACC 11606]
MNPIQSRPPFRWNLQKAEQLGTLPQEGTEAYPEFLQDLRSCAAKVLAFSDNCDLVFVGRSPESLYDHLQGALQDTHWQDRLQMLNISIGGWEVTSIEKENPGALKAIEQQFLALGLTPLQILARPHPVAFVDLVCGGSTFLSLYLLLLHWAARDGVPARVLCNKLRFIGIVEALKTSPNTWRWHQKAKWGNAPIPEVKNVSVPYRFWFYLGDQQHKVARWNPPFCWTETAMQEPPREFWHLQALGFARTLHLTGSSKTEKQHLVREMVQLPAMKEGWYRTLVMQIKAGVRG